MLKKVCIVLLVLCVKHFRLCSSIQNEGNPTRVVLESGIPIEQPQAWREILQIYCYQGQPKNIIHIWRTVILQVNHSTDDYKLYEGPNANYIKTEYEDHQKTYINLQLFSIKQKSIKLDPFNTSCVGIASKDAYSVVLNIFRIDVRKLLLLATGILLYLSADKLSKNSTFHYISGVCFGVCASFLILIYLLSRMFPKKPFMYSVLGCGWTIVIYFLQLLWENLRLILDSYKSYLIWYLVVSSVISFILCYRWGPIENQRTINLIKWSLQLISLISVFYSSDYKEAAMGQIVVLLISHNLPKKWVSAPKAYWKKRFPPKLQLLSNDEYYEQGVRETAKALEELRKYCSSPECNQWKTALKIKDVKRFASFIEGNSHLSDEEILEYETSIQGELTDEENENSFTDEDEDD